MSSKLEQLQALVAPVVEALGYQCWGVEFLSQGRHSLLRIYIDKQPDGVLIEDCEIVSRQISGVLDVEDPISAEYTLEVSSPGMDRPLFTLEQFASHAGEQVKIKLRSPFEGRRNFQGLLRGVEEQDVVVQAAFPQRELDQGVVDAGILEVEDAHQALVGVFWHAAIWWMGRTGGQTPGGKAAKCC